MSKSPRIDTSTEAILLNRYVAFVKRTFYSQKGKSVPIKYEQEYAIQWKNIKADLKGIFTNPIRLAPQIAFSLFAFWYIFQNRHMDAYLMAFGGAIAHDASAQSSVSGEPSSISWTHTVVSNTNGIVLLFEGGLNTPNLATYDGNTSTSIIDAVPARSSYYLLPPTGAKTVTFDGGNIKVGGSISFTGVDQSVPIGATNSSIDDSSPKTLALTTTVNNSVRVDAMVANNGASTNPTVALDTGTLRFNPVTPQNQFRCGYFGYTDPVASAGATNRTWTFADSGETRKFIAFELLPASGAVANPQRMMTGLGL